MESKKLEKPRENGTFSTVQGVMKPDEDGRRVFPTNKPKWHNSLKILSTEQQCQIVAKWQM